MGYGKDSTNFFYWGVNGGMRNGRGYGTVRVGVLVFSKLVTADISIAELSPYLLGW